MFIEWKEEFSMRIEEIDNQHKKLVGMINEVHEGISQGRDHEFLEGILKDMINYSRMHFETEERLMTEHDFPGYEKHRNEHDLFRRKAQDLYERFKGKKDVVTIETAVFLRSWLETHLLGTDKLYVDFFAEKGVR